MFYPERTLFLTRLTAMRVVVLKQRAIEYRVELLQSIRHQLSELTKLSEITKRQLTSNFLQRT